jgi:hypothetical protein
MFIVKLATAGLFGMAAVTALAQAPSMDISRAPVSSDVRAGLDNGDRDSLPRSDKAGNIEPSNTRSTIAATLPSPPVAPDASAREFLKAARESLAAGRTGQAQQSLEMAETRSLGGSISPELANAPTDNPVVTQIRQALRALGDGDRAQSLQIIDAVLTN